MSDEPIYPLRLVDIVDRLRDVALHEHKEGWAVFPVCDQAANEIERLRNNVNVLALELMRHENQVGPCKGTVDCDCGVSRIMHVVSFKEVCDE